MSPAGRSNAPSEMAATPGGNDVGFLIVNAVSRCQKRHALLRTLRRGIAADTQPGRRSTLDEAPSRL